MRTRQSILHMLDEERYVELQAQRRAVDAQRAAVAGAVATPPGGPPLMTRRALIVAAVAMAHTTLAKLAQERAALDSEIARYENRSAA